MTESDFSIPKATAFKTPLRALLGVGEFAQTDVEDRKRTIFIFSSIGFVTLLLFGFFKQSMPELRLQVDGQIQIFESLFMILPVVLLSQHHHAPAKLLENLIVVFGFIIFLLMVLMGGFDGTSILWTFVFPYLVFYVRGQKAGWLVGTTFAVLAPLLMLQSARFPLLYAYSHRHCISFGFAYFFSVLTAAYFNVLRTNFLERLQQLVEFNTQKALEHLKTLEFNSIHDVATQLFNRQGMMEHIRKMVAEPDSEHPILAMVGIRFGRIIQLANIVGIDSVNHSLLQLSRQISCSFSCPVVVGRTQLDQLVLLFSLSRPSELLVEEILALEHLPNQAGAGGFSIQNEFSFGLAYHHIGVDTADASELLRKSEQALLYAVQKQLHYQLYDETLDQYFLGYNVLYEKLRSVVLNHHLQLYYQPQVDLHTHQLIGAESLCRWQDPQDGFIAPDQFIPVIESTGLLRTFSLWTIEQGLHDCAQWQALLPGVKVSINLSANALLDEVVITRLEQTLVQLQLDPSLVMVEITESALLKFPEKALEMMHRIVQHGMQLSVDDYGVGFSSLSYIKAFPAHEIKMDQSFIFNLMTSSTDQAIVQSTIALVHDLHRKLLAEGVEDATTAQQLAQMGCDYAQGWHYAKALPLNEFIAWAQTRPTPPSSTLNPPDLSYS